MENKALVNFDDIKTVTQLVQTYNEQQGCGDIKFTVTRIEAEDGDRAEKMA